MDTNKKILGFTLVEVLVFITILSLFFITATAVISFSIHNMKTQENKIIASFYAEELLEWLRGEKEQDWQEFINSKASPDGKTYCFPELNWSYPSPCENKINNFFLRKATLKTITSGDSTQINVSILVSWLEVNNTYSIPINTLFSAWE